MAVLLLEQPTEWFVIVFVFNITEHLVQFTCGLLCFRRALLQVFESLNQHEHHDAVGIVDVKFHVVPDSVNVGGESRAACQCLQQ